MEIQGAEKIAEQTKVETLAVTDVEEFSTVEVEGSFRGYWRDVPRRDRDGNAVKDENGKQVIDRQFKLSRSVKRKADGATIRQAAWLTEADAKRHGLEDGVKYRLRISVGENMTASKGNDGQYADEYSFADPTVVEVISK